MLSYFVCNGGGAADCQVALPLDVFFASASFVFGGRYADVDGAVAARLEFRFGLVCGADTVPQAENPLLQTAAVDFRLLLIADWRNWETLFHYKEAVIGMAGLLALAAYAVFGWSGADSLGMPWRWAGAVLFAAAFVSVRHFPSTPAR